MNEQRQPTSAAKPQTTVIPEHEPKVLHTIDRNTLMAQEYLADDNGIVAELIFTRDDGSPFASDTVDFDLHDAFMESEIASFEWRGFSRFF